MHLSISGTCSFAEAMFSCIQYNVNPSWVHSNWLSARITVTENLPFLYALTICFRAVIRVSCFTFLIISAVTNLIWREVLVKYGTSFTNIMFTATVTSLYCNSKSGDLSRLTDLGFFQVVLSFRAPISSPKMIAANKMSFFLIGQFGRRFSLTMHINCFVLGLPIVFGFYVLG